MKTQFFIPLFILVISFQQNKIVGRYRDNFGTEFIFNSDSTYEYTAVVHISASWSKGKWKVKNDTIFYKAIPSYDTIRIVGRKDSMRLSRSKTPQLISFNSIKGGVWPISIGEQDIFSGKLYFLNNRLYEINKDGKLIIERKTRCDRNDGVKYDPWFTKLSE